MPQTAKRSVFASLLATLVATSLSTLGCSETIDEGGDTEASDLSLSGMSASAQACLASVGTTVASGKLNSHIAKTLCFALLAESGPVNGFVCGVVVGAVTSKLGPKDLKDAVCASVEDNLCSQAACDPIGLAWRLLGANGKIHSQTCAHSTIAQWIEVRNGQVIGQGAETCPNAPNRTDPNSCQGGRGPSRPCP